MNTVLLGLIVGCAAGIIDVIPMAAQKLAWNANLSAFIQWLFLGVVIANCSLGLPGWATGLILGIVGALPVVLITSIPDPKSAIPILCMSAILGTAVGIVTHLERFRR